MWLCSKCGESIEEDTWQACWKCGATRAGAGALAPAPKPSSIQCTRCQVDLAYVGTKSFHEGTRWGVFGELGELFVNRERLDFYYCPRCGRVEFFVDGVGEDLRPK